MFKRIVAHNFLSWENLTFEFTPGVTLIEGFNHDDQTSEGSGKSAILNALSWGLYGRVPKDTKIDDVIRDGAKSCEVVIELDSGAKIVRSRKPNDLYIDAADRLKGKDAKETQVMIESLIGMSFETFLQSVYWAQNYPNKFVTANEEEKAKILSEILNLKQFDRARVITVAKLREIEIESAGAEKAQAKIEMEILSIDRQITDFTFLKSKQEHERKANIARLTSELDTLGDELQALEAELADGSVEQIEEERGLIKTFLSELDVIKAELDQRLFDARVRRTILADFTACEAKLQDEQTEIGEFDETLIKNDISTAQEELEYLQRVKTELAARFQSIDQQKRLVTSLTKSQTKKTKEINDLQHDLNRFQNPDGQTCPSCGTLLTDANADHVGEVISQWESRIQVLHSELAALNSEIEGTQIPDTQELSEDLAQLDREISQANTKVRQKSETLLQLEIRKSKVENELRTYSDLQTKLASLPEVSEADVRKDLEGVLSTFTDTRKRDQDLATLAASYEYRSKDFKTKSGVFSKLTADLAREKSDVATPIDEKLATFHEHRLVFNLLLADAQETVEAIRGRASRLQTLKDGFKEIKAFVFQNILGELTRKANVYLAELFEVPTAIQFSNLSEDGEIAKILVEVTFDGIRRPLGLYSGGQFRRIQLAVDLALSEIVSARGAHPLQLRILDEYFKDLSESSMDKALHLLEKLPGSTVLIEHNSMFKAIVNNVFSVELEDGVSRKAA